MSKLPLSRRALSILAVLVPLAFVLGYVALRSGPLAPVAVTVVQVESKALRPSLFGVGTVEARQLYRLGPVAPGRLLRLSVQVGDTVKAGQVLGEMDPVDSDDRLRSQQAQVQRAAAAVADTTARHAFAQQQAQAQAGKDKLAPGVGNVAPRQADHEDTPGMRSTTWMRERAVSAFSL